MTHKPGKENLCTAVLDTVTLYVTDYELSRDRRYNFQNRSGSGMYFTDNGSYPAYLKLKGYVMKSECAQPCVEFNEMMDNSTVFYLDFDGMYFHAARLKSYNVVSDVKSKAVKCEIVLCCDSYITSLQDETEVGQ